MTSQTSQTGINPTATATATASAVAVPSLIANGCEPHLKTMVREILWPVIVCGKGSRDFGLEQRRMLRGDDVPEIGGWLRRAKHKSGGGRQFSEAQYYVLDEEKGFCLIKNDEVKEALRFQKMLSVTAHMEGSDSSPSIKRAFFFKVVAMVGGEQRIWELSPSDTSDKNLVLAWTSALQVRSKTYDVVLDLDHEKAVKVALWCQSLYRGFRGRMRAEKLRMKRQNQKSGFGIQRMVSGLLGSKTMDDEDEDSDEEEDLNEILSAVSPPSQTRSFQTSINAIGGAMDPLLLRQAASSASAPGGTKSSAYVPSISHAFTSLRRSFFSSSSSPNGGAGREGDQNISNGDIAAGSISDTTTGQQQTPQVQGGTAVATNESVKKKAVKFPSDKSLAIPIGASSSAVVPSQSSSSPQRPCRERVVAEDEIWENQRWSAMAIRGSQVYRGWSEVALLPAERGGLSDRLGTIKWDSLSSVPVPKGWKIVKPWTLDIHSTPCNSEGWSYAQTFASLDSNLASGRSHSAASARWLVRRRRWYRVRELDFEQLEAEATNPQNVGDQQQQQQQNPNQVLANYDMCTDQSLLRFGWLGMRGITTGRWSNCFTFLPSTRAKEHLGVALCYFKKSTKVFNEDLTFRYKFDYHQTKHVRVKFLDNLCVVSDTVATRDQPGLFSLHLCGEPEPRIFNAHSAEARAKWVSALSHAISISPGPCYEALANRRSMRKGAAWELSRATTQMKDLVGGSVRGVKHGLNVIKQGGKNVLHSGSTTGSVFMDLHREESDPDMVRVEHLREEFRRNDALWTTAPRKFSSDSVGSLEIPPLAQTQFAPPPTHQHGKPPMPSSRNTTPTSARSEGARPKTFDFAATPQQQQQQEANGGKPSSVNESGTDPEDGNALSAEESEAPGNLQSTIPSASSKKNALMRLSKKILRKTSQMSQASASSDIPPPLNLVVRQTTNQSQPESVISGNEVSPPASPTLSSLGTEVPGIVLSAQFEMPPPYENIVFDGYFDMSVDDFDTFFFREEEFTRDILTAEKMTEIELEPWTNGISVGSEHRRKYRMPRAGVVPPGPSLHLLTRIQTCPGKGYVIDQVCSTPEMPFGQYFSTDFRNVFAAEGPKRCRVIISQRVTLFKTLMAQGFIRSGTKREITAYYKNFWTGFVRKWIVEKRSHLLSAGSSSNMLANIQESSAEDASGEGSPSNSADQAAAESTTTLSVRDGATKVGGLGTTTLFAILFVGFALILALSVYAFMLSTRLSKMEELLLEMNLKLSTSKF